MTMIQVINSSPPTLSWLSDRLLPWKKMIPLTHQTQIWKESEFKFYHVRFDISGALPKDH